MGCYIFNLLNSTNNFNNFTPQLEANTNQHSEFLKRVITSLVMRTLSKKVFVMKKVFSDPLTIIVNTF